MNDTVHCLFVGSMRAVNTVLCSFLLSIGTWNVTDSQCTDCVRLQYAGGEYCSLFLSIGDLDCD